MRRSRAEAVAERVMWQHEETTSAEVFEVSFGVCTGLARTQWYRSVAFNYQLALSVWQPLCFCLSARSSNYSSSRATMKEKPGHQRWRKVSVPG